MRTSTPDSFSKRNSRLRLDRARDACPYLIIYIIKFQRVKLYSGVFDNWLPIFIYENVTGLK